MPTLHTRVRRAVPALTALTLGCATFGSLTPPAQAQSVSVNFVGGQNGPNGADTVTGTAGVVRDSNWNNAAGNAGTNIVLHTSTGATTGAGTLTFTSPNTWAATGATPGGGSDASLMSGYLDNLQNGGSISVAGLGAPFTTSGYDVIIFQNTDSAGSWGYTVADNAGHTGTRYGLQTTGGGGNYPLGGTNGYVEGTATTSAGPGFASNYVRITGLTGANCTITANAGTTGDGRVRPNGFQIVALAAAPEPSSWAGLGVGALGLAGLGLRARRRKRIGVA